MKIYLLIFIFLNCATTIVGQQNTLSVNGNTYLTVKQIVKNDFGSKDTLVKMYRIEKGVKKYLLTHFLYKYDKDCNNKFKDIGKIECRGDSIIFETLYLQMGHDAIPEKKRQIYKVQTNGILALLSDKTYMSGKWTNTKDISNKSPE